MKKVLITGGSGLLGQYLNLASSEKFDIFTLFRNNPGNCRSFPSSKINITNIDELKSVFKNVKLDFVIHSAAISNSQPVNTQSSKEYFETNVKATENIAVLCEKYKSKLIYISTDLVYAGYRGSFLKEDAKLNPITLYAETKLMGEMKIMEATENFLILRSSLLYGIGLNHSSCHFQKMFNDLKNKKPVKLFTDQFRTPVSLKDAANIITKLTETDLTGEIINLGGLERISRSEFGEILCSLTGFDKNLIQKIKMDDIPGFPKVGDVSLNIEKLQSLGFKPRSIEENISEIVNAY